MEQLGPDADLQKQINDLRQEVSTLKLELAGSFRAIAELLGDDGGIAITLKQLRNELSILKADVHTTDDALGDVQTLRSLGESLREIKLKLGVR